MTKIEKILIIIFLICSYIYCLIGNTYLPIEALNIPAGIGYDIKKTNTGITKQIIPVSFYIFNDKAPNSQTVQTGIGDTVGETRENRQLISSKKFILGLERVFILSEGAARYGIENEMDVLFKNPAINDLAQCAVSKETPATLLNLKYPGYTSASDYIEAMIEHADEFNFFGDNYRLIYMYNNIVAEGKNLVLPYIEITDSKAILTGLAVFHKDKLAQIIGLKEGRILNLLREKKARGILSIKHNPEEYIDIYANSKRKVKCEIINDKFTFTINLELTSEILNNTLYHNIRSSPKVREKLENDMSKEVEKMCNSFIDKMQKEYQLDCLNLGEYAVAKYGRQTGTDWNKVVSNSEIKVMAKVKITGEGRGEFDITPHD